MAEVTATAIAAGVCVMVWLTASRIAWAACAVNCVMRLA